ncbi:MAG: site-specific DNA-methyltransferase [Chitinophagales bacterium]|nr:site-specific DNA-methyltransferase [Chitinophagales bacterium]MBP9845857.1 site-specific DNA-methyltransferase [Saprospiraceae bacterium]
MTEDNTTTNVQLENGSPAFAKPVLCAGAVIKDGISLIHGDSLQALKSYGDNYFDVAIVDPPYGIGFDGHDQIIGKKGKDKGFSSKKLYDIKEWDKDRPTIEYFAELKRVSKNQIIWGGNYFADLLQPTKGWIYWDKKPNGENLTFSDGELAWTSFNKPLKAFSYGWIGFGMLNSGERKIHPTQKPTQLYKWLLENYTKEGDLILDTHLGSGSIAIACHQMKRKLIGYEIDADYYRKACKRFEEQTRQTALW